MHLYTFILDYRGGTYVAQISAAHENEALSEWVSQLHSNNIADAVSQEVAVAFEGEAEDLCQLQGLIGVWYACAGSGKGRAELNIVRTAS